MRLPSLPGKFASKDPQVLADFRRLQSSWQELLDYLRMLAGAAAPGADLTVQKTGVDVGTEPKLNFIEGTNVTLTVADNPGSDRVDVTVNSTGGAPSGAAGGDLAGTYPNPTVTQARGLREPSGPTTLVVGAINDGEFIRRVGSTLIGGSMDVAVDIAPLHWWTASVNSQSGGLVDSLTDQGSSPKNFAQTGAARAPVATDGDGVTYLALDGAADFYVAGVAADWKFLSSINVVGVSRGFTIAMIFNRTAITTATEDLLNTNNEQAANTGFAVVWMTDGAAAGAAMNGPGLYVTNGTDSHLGSASRGRPYLAKEVLIIRYTTENGGTGGNLTIGGSAAALQTDCFMRRNGSIRAYSHRGPAADPTANPSFALTLGRRASTADRFSGARIYEIILDDKAWSDRQVTMYEERARTVFKVPGI